MSIDGPGMTTVRVPKYYQVKREILRMIADLAPGTEVFAKDDAEQPAGQVVQSAPHPAGGFDALVSMQIAAADKALVAGGRQLTLEPLPYALLADL